MLRTFTLATRKLLFPRPLSVCILTSDAATSSSSPIYDVRRRIRQAEHHHPMLSLVAHHNSSLLVQTPVLMNNVRWASGKKGFQVPDPSVMVCNMISMLKCVDLAHLKDAPAPAFWTALIIGGTQVVIPLLELIGGYSQTLTIFQLNLAALTVASLAGVKWGLAVSKNPLPVMNWETMKWIGTPNFIALVGLSLPYPLGFLTVAGAVVTTLYLDLKSCIYPPWANATRLLITLTTLAGLFMGLTAYLLFHNKENEKKKDEKKEKKKGDLERKDGADEEEKADVDKSKTNGRNEKQTQT